MCGPSCAILTSTLCQVSLQTRRPASLFSFPNGWKMDLPGHMLILIHVAMFLSWCVYMYTVRKQHEMTFLQALGIARGLAYLHEQGVIHRDIKSVSFFQKLSSDTILSPLKDNILVTRLEEAVICDFGCSRIIDASRTLGNLTTSIKGTEQYLAFEIIALRNQYPKHSEKSDVWAFGMTVYVNDSTFYNQYISE